MSLTNKIDTESTSDVPEVTSILITGVGVTLDQPVKGRPCIKLVVDDETEARCDFESKDIILRWSIKPGFALHSNEVLAIQVRDRPQIGKTKQIAEANISFADALSRLNTTSGGCKDVRLHINPRITIDLESIDGCHGEILHDATNVLAQHKTILGRLGKSKGFLETLLGLGTATAEMHHVSKAVLGAVNVVYQRLEDQDLYNSLILELAGDMAQTLGYIEDIEQFARLVQLEMALRDVRPLIEDTTNFILKYTSRARTWRSVLSTADRDRIEDLKIRFERFKGQFDRGVLIQSASTLQELLVKLTSNDDDAILAELKPKDIDLSSPHAECMSGTRQDILEEIDKWALDMQAPNVLWIKGHPGVGKSAIASSLVERLTEARRLGSSFFFQRDRATVMTPMALWRKVAFDLGCQYPTVREILVAKLKRGEVPPTTVNAEKLFHHFVNDPLMSSHVIPTGRLPIVVVDALDECRGLEGQLSSHRQSFIRALENWSKLPTRFKLIVTSRDEADIGRLFQKVHHQQIYIPSGRRVNSRSSDDIRSFLTVHFQQIAEDFMLNPEEWPGSHTIEELTSRAAGLFIWAMTIVRFMSLGDPEEQLNLILEGSGAGDIGKLYSRMLEVSFPETTPQVTSAFQSILGTIILARTPLSASVIASLLSLKTTTMTYICRGLHSVLEAREALQISHQSFSDFLVDKSSCPSRFFVDLKEVNCRLTLACLQTMSALHFNIFSLNTSHERNSEIVDLALRIEQSVPAQLHYSCFFWTSHLVDSEYNPEILESIQVFMKHHFLFWLEILSICKRVGAASSILAVLNDWIPVGIMTFYFQGSTKIERHPQNNHECSVFARDMKKFVAAFARPISESAPHIYLSALPFAPSTSLIPRRYSIAFPRAVSIEWGGQIVWSPLQHILLGHTDVITCITFSSDGTRITSGSEDKTVRVWDSETGQAMAGPFMGHKFSVTSVAFSPNGLRVASGSEDKRICMWDIETEDNLVVFEGHTLGVTSVAFSPDGKLIASGSKDKTVRLWDIETGKSVAGPLFGHAFSVTSVAFVPDGKNIVSISIDEIIRIWDSETRLLVAGPFKDYTDWGQSGRVPPDYKWIDSRPYSDRMPFWDYGISKFMTGPLRDYRQNVTCPNLSPDTKRIISCSTDNTIRVWDREAGELVADPFISHSSLVTSVFFSPNGKRIVSGSGDRTVYIWDSESGEVVVGPFRGHTDWITSVAFSPNGEWIVSGSFDKTIRIWDSETGVDMTNPLVGHTRLVTCVGFSPDGEWVVSGSNDKTIRVWDWYTGETVIGPFMGHTHYVTCVAFSPDGTRVASGSEDKTICMWDVETEDMLVVFEGHTLGITSLAFSPDASLIISGSQDKTICVWDSETGQALASPLTGHASSVTSVAFSPNGMRIASGSIDKSIRIWDIQTGEPVIVPFTGHTDSVRSVAFSPDGKRIVSGSNDETIRVCDIGAFLGPSEEVINEFMFTDFSMEVTSPNISLGNDAVPVRDFHWELCILMTSTLLWRIVDGWVLGPDDELLFWVPPDLRDGLLLPHIVCIIGKCIKTRINLDSFVHGDSWTLCRDESISYLQ
ncbi:WD40 repeat-like protein [Serendipita vermifera]|nr:WD40 repeat-like protein [Serendipita vermifera]